jgi:hypothetical protein
MVAPVVSGRVTTIEARLACQRSAGWKPAKQVLADGHLGNLRYLKRAQSPSGIDKLTIKRLHVTHYEGSIRQSN